MTDIGRRGSVRQAGNGTWYFVVDASYPGASRRQTRRRGFPSRRAAQSGLTALLNDLGNHQYVAPTRLTLTEFVETRFLPVLAGEVRPSTFDSYARNLRLHVLPELGRVQLQALDAGALTACYQRLARSGRKDQAAGKRLSPRSVRYIHTIVRRALEMALEWDLVSRNVADRAKAPKPAATAARHEFPTWPRQVLSEFLQWEREDRLYALWLLFATTGMRRGEALGLSWAAVDLDHRRLSVRRTLVGLEGGLPVWSDPKTARGRRVVALDAATVGALRSHRVRQVHERLSSGSAYVDHGLIFCWEDGPPSIRSGCPEPSLGMWLGTVFP